MPDFPPAVAVEIEGDYSDYTVKWDSVGFASASLYPVHGAMFSGDETVIIFCDINDIIALLQVSDGTILSENAGWGYGFIGNQYASASTLQKYMATTDGAESTLRIFKDGVLLKTITPVDPSDDFQGAIVSKSGRYIALAYWDDNEGDYRMRCYEGS